MPSLSLKRTPLYAAHQALGARLIDFGGWEMPVQYTSILDEHQAVRRASGIFDISHMGQLRATGPLALDFLNHALTNDVRKLMPGHGQYTIACNDQGGAIDDLYVYCLAANDYLLIVNASRIDADFDWFQDQRQRFSDGKLVTLENESDRWAAIAVQGPSTAEFIDQCFAATPGAEIGRVRDLKKNGVGVFAQGEHRVWVARTGYTGEDGFEIVAPTEAIEEIWACVMAAGRQHGLKPAGLGARDTLRTEMGYPLYGHELDENTTPVEAGLNPFVALEKVDFVGRGVLAKQRAEGPAKKCVAFKMSGGGPPPRAGYAVWGSGVGAPKLGQVSSGTQSPTLAIGIGLAYVPPGYAPVDTRIEIEIRGKRFPAVVARKPLYRRPVEPPAPS